MSAQRIPTGLVPALIIAAAVAAVPAQAAPQGAGHAYDLSVNVSILTAIPALTVAPQAEVQVAAQSAGFHQTDTAGPLHLTNTPVAPLVSLDTGVLNAETEWVPPGANGFMVVGSQASAANINLSAVNLTANSLLSLQAPIVRSTAMISGWCPPAVVHKMMATDSLAGDVAADVVYGNGFDEGNLSAKVGGGSGGGDPDGDGSDNTGIAVSVSGTSFLNLPDHPAPNTQSCILGNAACLTLNERSSSGDGITTLSSSANGLHLTANVLGVITADVIIAHSDASLSCN